MTNTYNSNTITLTGLNGAYGSNTSISGFSAQPLTQIDDTYLNTILKTSLHSDFVKRYEVIETVEDLLALSVTWKRLRDTREKQIYINSLLSNGLFSHVTGEDRERADTIRDYFSKKIMLWTLKEVKLSAYRQDLSEFIHGDGKKFTEKMLPIVYRLPEFYEYDVEFDLFKQNVSLEIAQFKTGSKEKITTLMPVKSFYKSNKRVKQFEYWLKDNNGNAHMIAIEPKNPLKHIWDKMFINSQLRIEGTYYPKQYDDLQYYQLLNWKLA